MRGLRDDDKGQVVFGVVGLQVDGVETAGAICGRGPLKGDFPAGVFEVVIVEVDGSVLGAGGLEVVFVAGPVVSGYCSGWQVDGAAVQVVRSDVADAVRADVAGEVPVGDEMALVAGREVGQGAVV